MKLKQTKFYLLLTSIVAVALFSVACADTSKSTVQTPQADTVEWYEWVEKHVQTTDGKGHGPDLGEQEWCNAVNRKLMNAQTGLTPCSDKWSKKVTQRILKQAE